MRFWILVSLMAVCLCSSAMAQRSGPPSPAAPDALEQLRDRALELADEFNLTPAQRAVITAELADGMAQAQPIVEQMVANRAVLIDLIAAEPPDPAAIDAVADAQGDLAGQLLLIHADVVTGIRVVLTDEQLGFLGELRAMIRSQVSAAVARLDAGLDRRGMRRELIAGRRADRLSMLADEFGITPDQRAAIRATIEASVPEILAVASDMAANRLDLNALLTIEPVDTAAVESVANAQGQAFADLVRIRSGIFIDIRGVLTDEQLDALDALRAELEQRFVDRLGSLGG